MANVSDVFVVDTYQINVGAGDCSIHILAKNPGLRAARGTVVKAILIDGGDIGKVNEYILSSVEHIETRYDLSGQPNLQFDAVVVSHWDQDHWLGGWEFLSEALKQDYAAKAALIVADLEAGKKVPKRVDLTKVTCKYLKYVNSKPVTTFYCPTWASSDELYKGDPNAATAPKFKGHCSKYQADGNELSIYIGDFVLDVDKAVRFGKLTSAQQKSQAVVYPQVEIRIPGQCVIVSEANNLIGRDLFTGNIMTPGGIKKSPWSDIKDLETLVTQHGLAATHMPGFVCIAAGRQVIQRPYLELNQADSIAVKDEGPYDLTNAMSIASIIVWPPVSAGDKVHISLYTGGDSEGDIETRILPFLRGRTVTFLKAGHHGSAKGTNLTFFTSIKPRYVVFSAGGMNFGHPHWTKIAYMHAWYAYQSLAGNIVSTGKPIWTTCFPNWFLSTPTSVNYYSQANVAFNLEFLIKNGAAPFSTFQDSMDDLYTAYKTLQASKNAANKNSPLIPDLPSIFADYNAWLEAVSPGKPFAIKYDDALKKAAEELGRIWFAQKWAAMSVIGEAELSAVEPSLVSKGAPPVPRIKHLFIQHRDLDGTDGIITVERGGVWVAGTERLKKAEANSDNIIVTEKAPVATNKRNRPRDQKENQQKFTKRYEDLDNLDEYLNNEIAEREAMIEAAEKKQKTTNGLLFMANKPIAHVSAISSEPMIEGLDDSPVLFALATGSSNSVQTVVSPYRLSSDDAVSLKTGSDMGDFVDGLHLGGIWLSKPTTLLADGTATTAKVSQNDELHRWLRDTVGLKALNLTLSTSGTPPVLQLRSMSAQISIPCSSQQNSLEFDLDTGKDHVSQSLGASGPAGDDTGYTYQKNGVVFGLKSAATSVVTVADLCKFIELETPLAFDAATAGIQLKMIPETTPSRSALWFFPDVAYRTILQLTFQETGTGSLETLIKRYLPSVDVSIPKFTIKKTCEYLYANDTGSWIRNTKPQITINSDITIKGHTFSAYATLEATGTIITLQWNSSSDPLQALVEYVNDLIKSAGHSVTIENSFADWLSKIGAKANISLRRISFKFGQKSLEAFSLDFELDLTIGCPQGSRIPCQAHFSWEQGKISFTAGLWQWPDDIPGNASPLLDPDYSPMMVLEPKDPKDTKIQKFFSLKHLSSSFTLDEGRIPQGIPTEVRKAVFTITGQYVGFYGRIVCETPALKKPTMMNTKVPRLSLNALDVSLKYIFKSATAPAGFDLSLKGQVKLYSPYPLEIETPEPAILDVSVEHFAVGPSGTEEWILSASVENLKMAALYPFFSKGWEQDAVMHALQHFDIPRMSVVYDYSGGLPSRFVLSGVFVIAGVELDLKYEHRGTSWLFQADLGADKRKKLEQGKPITIGTIIGEIERDIVSYLPDVISNVPINPKDFSLHFVCKKLDAPPDALAKDNTLVGSLVVGIVAELGPVKVAFVRLQNYHKGDVVTPALAKSGAKTLMLRVTLDKLPFGNIDLVKDFQKPFDSLNFIYASTDLTRGDTELLNSTIFSNSQIYEGKLEPLTFKDNSASKQPMDVLLKGGCHFMLTLIRPGAGPVVLDYAFGAAQPKAGQQVSATDTAAIESAKEMKGGTEVTEVPFAKKANSLDISSIGFKLGNKKIGIILTAKVKMGPIGFELIGFELGIDMSVHHLTNLEPSDISIGLQGLAIEYDSPPIIMAGLFTRVDMKLEDGSIVKGFAGGVEIGIAPYNFLAAGMYGSASKPRAANAAGPSDDGWKTIFVFGRLNGPLIEFEFAEINGICGGFGYNSFLKFPRVEEIKSFPFMNPPPPGDGDAISRLEAFNKNNSITPRRGEMWFAAGLAVKAFQMIDIQAIVAVSLGNSVRLGLFAEAVAVLPKAVPGKNIPVFLMVDFVFEAVVDFGQGSLEIAGQLTPRSFILDPSCHLTGGFALSHWFAGSNHDGDWVFTIGGYHPQFNKPGHYPSAPRLGISWRYDDELQISGEAYFAITPRLCMAGVRLAARFVMGSFSAHFDAHADFLVNYDPFQYIGEVGVSVGAAYDLDLLFFTKRISVDLNALLRFHGPPMAGTLHIDVEVFSVDVAFGPSYQPRPAIDLQGFWNMLCQGSDTSVPHTFSLESGDVRDSKSADAKDKNWLVRAGPLSFRVQLRAATSSITHGSDTAKGQDKVHAKLMKEPGQNLIATTQLFIKHIGGPHDGKDVQFRQRPVKKSLPSALWGAYDHEEDPERGGGGKLFSSPGPDTVPHLMGATFLPPMAQLSKDNIPAYDAIDAFSLDLPGNNSQFPVPEHYKISIDKPNDDAKEQLKQVVASWAGNHVAQRLEVANLMADVVKSVAGKKAGDRYRTLRAEAPTTLLKQLESRYNVPPRLMSY